jgi:hypothetical protein
MPLKDNWVYRASDLVAGFAIGAVVVLTQDLLMPRSLGLLGGNIITAVNGKKVAALGRFGAVTLVWPAGAKDDPDHLLRRPLCADRNCTSSDALARGGN